jgi:hypothetical protein
MIVHCLLFFCKNPKRKHKPNDESRTHLEDLQVSLTLYIISNDNEGPCTDCFYMV